MKSFRKTYRVYHDDIDFNGVLYHGNFVKIIEHARSDWLAEVGVDQTEIIRSGFGFAVRSIHIDYLAPAYLGDDLLVESSVSELGRTSCVFEQVVTREKDARILCKASVKIVYISREFKPTALPEYIVQLAN